MAVAKKTTQLKLKDKTYRLTNNRSGASFLLQAGTNKNLVIFDESKGYMRAIRHCPNEKSIYLEDQSPYAIVEPVIFEQGFLEVKLQKQQTQDFLSVHPGNVANGGGLFEEIDNEAEASRDVEYDEIVSKIKNVVREKGEEEDGIYELEMVASVISGSLHTVAGMSKGELKRLIYNEIDSDPDYFINEAGDVTVFDDQDMHRKYATLSALKDGVIKKSLNGRSMLWGNGDKIIGAPQGVDITEHFSQFLSSDEGMLVFDEIKKRK